MPHKPAKPCAYPGCPNLTQKRFCEKHAALAAREYDKYTRHEPGKRYGYAWRIIRNRYAMAHPMCEKCLEAGRYRKMDVVHHILPLEHGGTNDVSNLISLCNRCHALAHIALGERNQPGD